MENLEKELIAIIHSGSDWSVKNDLIRCFDVFGFNVTPCNSSDSIGIFRNKSVKPVNFSYSEDKILYTLTCISDFPNFINFFNELDKVNPEENPLSGSLNNYYLARVNDPQREDQEPYTAECEDIIQALNMDFNEGCEFKAIWRTAAARLGNGKQGHSAKYDAEKRLHYAKRSLRYLKGTSNENNE